MSIEETMRDTIVERLTAIEQEHKVVILYACESGSRAWGFQSADSDYGIRFIYVHLSEWYLSIQEQRDVIEVKISDQLDMSGWDVRKALRLFRKSNPPLMEWLRSPIVYRERTNFAARLRVLADNYFSPRASVFHYLHMASGNYRDYLKGAEVWTKKYFYVLRPLLAVLWIEAEKGTVPVEFETLLTGLNNLSSEFREEVGRLLEAKRRGDELGKGPRNPVISRFIELNLERFSDGQLSVFPQHAAPYEELDALFLDAVCSR